jgi:hypothetical protein
MLTLNTNEARQADNRSTVINDAGKYIGVITRAEKLISNSGAQGLGLSFKSDSGATANYLDLYTTNKDGKSLPSASVVNALLCCLKLKEVPEGKVEVEKWDKTAQKTNKMQVDGYPSMMGKRIGLLLQKELSTNSNTGSDTERVIIYGVFEAGTEFTASEILDQATKPEKLAKMVEYIASHPVNDRRAKKTAITSQAQAPGSFDDFSDDIPF